MVAGVKLTTEQARDAHGKFAAGAEADARNASRHPVQPHDGRQSVGTHVSGKTIGAAGLGLLAGLAGVATKMAGRRR
jgi:hypothetical protein